MKRKLLILMASIMIVGCANNVQKKEEKVESTVESNVGTKDVTNNENKASKIFKDFAIEELKKIEKDYPKSSVATDSIKEIEKINEDENTITFKDDSGRESVTVKKRPQKVAVLYSSYASMYDELGGKIDLIIGGESAVEVYKFQRGKDITEGKNVIVTSPSGKNWNVENIIAEKPDLIICAMTSDAYATIENAANTAGIDLIGISFNGVRDYAKWSYIYTSINENKDAFKDVTLKTIEEVSKIIDNVPDSEDKKRVLSLMPTTKSVKGNYTQSDLGTMLNDLNTINTLEGEVKKGKSPRVDIGLEDIVKMNPEYIFVQAMYSDEYAKENLEKHLGDSDAWQKLYAVENNNVNYLPRGLFHNKANSKYSESYKMLFDILYGEK